MLLSNLSTYKKDYFLTSMNCVNSVNSSSKREVTLIQHIDPKSKTELYIFWAKPEILKKKAQMAYQLNSQDGLVSVWKMLV